MAQPKALRIGPLYRLSQTGKDTFAINEVINPVIETQDFLRAYPVNVTGGADLTGFGWLYSKVIFRQAAELQEAFALQTVLQLETLLNA